jgi:hypothetical protein
MLAVRETSLYQLAFELSMPIGPVSRDAAMADLLRLLVTGRCGDAVTQLIGGKLTEGVSLSSKVVAHLLMKTARHYRSLPNGWRLTIIASNTSMKRCVTAFSLLSNGSCYCWKN